MSKRSYLKSPDLFPIAGQDRNMSTAGFAILWVSMAVVLAAFAIGGDGIQQLPLHLVILATLVGSIGIGICMTLTGDIGIEHGLSFPVYLRAPFGTLGTHIPSIMRGFVASCWFGVNTFFGATGINAILLMVYGIDQWFLCFLLFAALQLFNTAFGIKAVERFANLAAPIIVIISGWMYLTLSDQAQAAGRDIWGWVENPVTGTAVMGSFAVIAMATMGFWGTLAADMPSLSRFIKAPKYERNWFKRNKGQLIGSLIAMPLVHTFMVVVGAVSYIAVTISNPVDALLETTSNVLLLGVLMLMIALAQWSTNTSSNLIPAATIFSNVGGPRVPHWVGVIVAGLIGVLVQPWNLFGIIVPALLVVGGILASIVGILVADYYFIRKRRVNVTELYEEKGQYHYWKGLNVAGLLSWVIGGGVSLLLPSYSYLVGLVAGGLLYYVSAKYWWFKLYKQAELENPRDELFLGLTVGRDWTISETEEEVVAEEAKTQTS
ncbi:NCS1 family transporter [Alkalicoccobacillus murimartini]|uniref:NCS1 family nucleobase:cation symporter-1 n=1 Tax=Alkalicoccobacillus murimartini TaxID=171685 RepID=A0ABT9YHD7_9BACI|nr:NCS1 family transporter [Alkalicoccobacillus murimartini]MDQ0207278.1 NCS1 family nucleobase:cation symporter-1 [Alkalicoccobacillus murimartini]